MFLYQQIDSIRDFSPIAYKELPDYIPANLNPMVNLPRLKSRASLPLGEGLSALEFSSAFESKLRRAEIPQRS